MSKWNPFDSETDRSAEDGSEAASTGDPDRRPDGGTTPRGDQSGGAPAGETGPDEPSRAELQAELETAREELEAARAEADRYESELADERAEHEQLREAVGDLADVAAANAEGDLTVGPGSPPTREVAPLYNAYGDLLTEWRDTVDRMSSFSEQVSSATDQVDARIDTVKTASHEVTEAVEAISEGSEVQTERLEDISDEMRTLSATIEEIASSAKEIAEVSRRASERGNAARTSASEAMDELDDLTDHAEETVENVERLNELLVEIEDVVEFITDVADQTNILALNANIEAARAGEAGAGFTVVADEVKNLANETKRATEDIKSSIERVHDQAEGTVDQMHETRTSVEATHDAVEEAVGGLDDVVDAVEDVAASMQEIDDATDSQATSTQEVVDMVDEVGDISERTTQEAATAADATHEQTTELATVSTRVSTLTERAELLEESLEGFELAAGGVGTADSEVTFDFWHAMGGEKALLLEELAAEFEAQADGVSISLTSKGDYRGTLDATLAAADRGDPPAIAQIFEIGSTRARDSGHFRPVERVLDRSHLDSLLDPVKNYYEFGGTLQALPFSTTNPLLAYNREAFARAGLDPDNPPGTFGEVRAAAQQLVDSGEVSEGITFATYSWFVEQWFAEANELLVDRENGRAGTPTTSNYDCEFGRDLLEWVTELETDGLYHNPGILARGDARNYFQARDAGMVIVSASSVASLVGGSEFDVGTAPFPVRDKRTGVVVGGSSLWVADGLDDSTYDAAEEFLTWLTQPEQQKRWHKETGYLPAHEDAVPQLRSEGWFEENPYYETAVDQLVATTDTKATRGAQMGPFDTVRTMVEETIDSIDTVDEVPDELERLDRKVTRELESYDSGR